MPPPFEIHEGDSLALARGLADNSIDSVVTDPPAGISFCGKGWDDDKGGRDEWIRWLESIMREAYRALKPGGYALVWAIPRTSHWTAFAVENAGFRVCDVAHHLFGSGFPKGLDVGKAMDRMRDDDIYHVTAFIAAARDAAGKTNGEIDAFMGFVGMAGHWTSDKSQPAVPKWEYWLKLKEFLQFGDSMDPEVQRLNGRKGKPGDLWYERPIIGVVTDGVEGHIFRKGGAGNTYNKEFYVTGHVSEEAHAWDGWNTALKPGAEHWILGQKPLDARNIAANVLKYGVGALNIRGCEVARASGDVPGWHKSGAGQFSQAPVVRLLGDLPLTVAQSVRRYFDGFNDVSGVWEHLPVQTVSRGKRKEKVLQPGMCQSGSGAGVGQKSPELRQEAHSGDTPEGFGCSEGAAGKAGGETWPLEGRGNFSGGIPSLKDRLLGGRGPDASSEDATETELHPRTSASDGSDGGASPSEGRGGSPSEWSQGGQPTGELGADAERRTHEGTQQGGPGSGSSERGECGTASRGGAFKVLARDVPDEWLAFFEPTGEFVKVAESNGFLGTDTFKTDAQTPEEIQERRGERGRWPSNLILSHSVDCCCTGYRLIKGCPNKVKQGGAKRAGFHSDHKEGGVEEGPRDTVFDGYGDENGMEMVEVWECVKGCPVGELEAQGEGLSRYFNTFRFTAEELEELRDPWRYQPKPTRDEKEAGCEELPLKVLNRVNPGGLENDPRWKPIAVRNNHPTVKSIGLMRWLCRLITPPGGVVLDLFCGSGTTGCGAVLEGFGFIGFDKNENNADAEEDKKVDAVAIARARIGYWASLSDKEGGMLPLFDKDGARLPILTSSVRRGKAPKVSPDQQGFSFDEED